jgi:hypothetical protein
MHELEDLIAQCVATATRAQVTDLIALAQLHADLRSILDLATDEDALAAARGAAELLEKLVLGDAQDPPETLRQVVKLIVRLQSIIGTTSANGSPSAAPPVAAEPATPKPDAEQTVPEHEQSLAAETGCCRWFGLIGYFKSFRRRKTRPKRS